jgi:hypothetical protein
MRETTMFNVENLRPCKYEKKVRFVKKFVEKFEIHHLK